VLGQVALGLAAIRLQRVSRRGGSTRGGSADGYLLQFINNAVVVAFGIQPGCHGAGRGAIAGIFDYPGRQLPAAR